MDLTLRQTAVFLTTYFTDESQTVRGLAQHLAVNKPAVTRALDRLGEIDLVRRKTDPADRRSVIAQRTQSGATMLKRLEASMVAAAADDSLSAG